MNFGRSTRGIALALALAFTGPAMIAATPVNAVSAPSPELAGEGWADKLTCAACVAGGLLAIYGGLAVVIAVLETPAAVGAIAICIDACSNAYAE